MIGSDTDGVSVSALFLAPAVDTPQILAINKGHLDYVYVDRRIAGKEPLKGFIYEKWEKYLVNYGSSVSSETVNKFGPFVPVDAEVSTNFATKPTCAASLATILIRR